jgi:hypothetical protein
LPRFLFAFALKFSFGRELATSTVKELGTTSWLQQCLRQVFIAATAFFFALGNTFILIIKEDFCPALGWDGSPGFCHWWQSDDSFKCQVRPAPLNLDSVRGLLGFTIANAQHPLSPTEDRPGGICRISPYPLVPVLPTQPGMMEGML